MILSTTLEHDENGGVIRAHFVEEVKLKRYRTPDGEPTCAVDVRTGHSCLLLGVKCLGTKEVCLLDSDRILHRRGENGLGYLIPNDVCPLWKENK